MAKPTLSPLEQWREEMRERDAKVLMELETQNNKAHRRQTNAQEEARLKSLRDTAFKSEEATGRIPWAQGGFAQDLRGLQSRNCRKCTYHP